jgi:hypothetical protein
MFLNAISGIVADVPDDVERSIHQIKEYLSKAIAFVGHAALEHPNEFVIALSAVATAIFTYFLATRTAGLFKETAGLREETSVLAKFAKQQAGDMKASVSAAEMAAGAAMLSAKAAVEAERAYLFAILTHDGVGMHYGADPSELPLETAGQIAQRLWVQFTLKNFGKTPAILKEISHQLIHGEEEWPSLTSYTPDLETRVPVVLGAGDSLPEKIITHPKSIIPAAQYKSAFVGDTAIWFYGYARYDDVFGREIEYRFRWKFSGVGPLRFDYHREFVREATKDGGDAA